MLFLSLYRGPSKAAYAGALFAMCGNCVDDLSKLQDSVTKYFSKDGRFNTASSAFLV